MEFLNGGFLIQEEEEEGGRDQINTVGDECSVRLLERYMMLQMNIEKMCRRIDDEEVKNFKVDLSHPTMRDRVYREEIPLEVT